MERDRKNDSASRNLLRILILMVAPDFDVVGYFPGDSGGDP